MYSTKDVLRRRRLVREALAVAPGERLLDVGCGPGFYVAELLDEGGPDGAVVGVDSSPHMHALARGRFDGRLNVAFRAGDTSSLPVEDATIDDAVCVEAHEYVRDAAAAVKQ